VAWLVHGLNTSLPVLFSKISFIRFSFGPVCAISRIFTRFSYMEDFNFGCLFSSMTGPLLISCYKSGPCKACVPPYTRAYCFLEHMVAAAFWARCVDEGIQLPGNTPWWHDRVCLVRVMGVPACFIFPLPCNVTCAETSFRFASWMNEFMYFCRMGLQSAVGSQGVRVSFQCAVELERLCSAFLRTLVTTHSILLFLFKFPSAAILCAKTW
jgi:hypothetical protein